MLNSRAATRPDPRRVAPDGATALYGSATPMGLRRLRHRAPAAPGLGLAVTIAGAATTTDSAVENVRSCRVADGNVPLADFTR
ncbi:hypothetical protein [Sphingobium ummariense]